MFGQATVNVSDSFRLIGGLRWTQDKVNVYHIRRTTLAGPGIGAATGDRPRGRSAFAGRAGAGRVLGRGVRSRLAAIIARPESAG